MPQKRTFIDSSVLIAAFKAQGELAENALAILDDADRDFVSNDFVRLELLPKPICYGNKLERNFYETFLDHVEHVVESSPSLIAEAQAEAELVGLSALDALHIAAAKRAECHEFVTAEKSTKPLFRVTGITITTIRPLT